MPGPVPGPHAEERRSIDAGWIILPPVGRDGDAPPLSLAGLGLPRALHPRARKLWSTWWSSPMALMWSESDVPQVERLLALVAWSWLGDSKSLSEIRQMEDRFGLSPQARRKLRWRIEGVDLPSTEAVELGHGQERELPPAGGKADPRLRVVKGGKAAG